MRHSKQSLRFIASLALFGLIASLLHAHPESTDESEAGRPLTETLAGQPLASAPQTPGTSVSPDDAHHEHSSRDIMEIEICLICRSHHDEDELLAKQALPVEFALDPTSGFSCLTQRTHATQTSSTGPRAPPAMIG